MFFYFKWYIKKRISSGGLLNNELDESRKEVARLIADIVRITDRDSQLVEARIKRLKEIIEEADSRIALYVKELEKGHKGETLYTSLGRGIREALAQGADAEEEQPVVEDAIILSPNAGIQQMIYEPPRTIPAAISLQTSELPETSYSDNSDVPPPSKHQIRSHIDLLLNEGVSAQEIASRLGISIGEVDLAINLRRK